ncbi:MAG TPA: hypothetical protein VMG08_04570 [Allosphingosinicella sp.]|nr:hypothetical protein [Allosphingosinicella sp.]
MPAHPSRVDAAAARLRAVARARLSERDRPTTDRRIAAINWWDNDDDPPEPWLRVGADHPDGPKGDPVLVILESARFDDMYFVSTLGQLRAGDEPRAIALGKWWRVVDDE